MGRTFYEGDDQFWTAPDLHYDATKDLEWYDPDAATTSNGTLNLQMDAFKIMICFIGQGWYKAGTSYALLRVNLLSRHV